MYLIQQDKYQVVPATNILSRKDLFVVNRVDRPDEGYAQDDDYFFQSSTSLEGVLWLVDCFFDSFEIADLESDYFEFEFDIGHPDFDYDYERGIEER